MAGVTNRDFWDFRVKTRAQFTKLAEQIANIDTSGGGGISELTSKMVVDALGYTPYNANNPANYITSAALTPYALKTDIPSLVGYATEDFVNNKLGDYATKDFVNNKLVDYAPLTSVQGFENRIGGLEGAVPQLNDRVTTVEGKVSSLNETVSTGENNLLDRVNVIETEYVTSSDLESAINGIDISAYLLKADLTKSRIQSTLGISDWALAATKPSYAWSEITSRPTALSQFTDDVVAGKYLPLNGGTMVGELAIKAGATNSATIRFSPNDGAINHWLGVNSAGVLWFSNNGWFQQYDILHSGNIGNYKSGDSAKLGGYGLTRFLLMTGRDYTEMDLNTIGGSQSIFTEIRTTEVTTTNSPYEGYGTLLSLKDGSGIAKMQFLGSYDSSVLYFRSQQKAGASITSAWKTIAFTDSNVASATKLKTRCKLWGNGFDGTEDVSGSLDVSGNIKASGNINATSITINGVTITASNGSITVNGNVLATGSITAKKSV